VLQNFCFAQLEATKILQNSFVKLCIVNGKTNEISSKTEIVYEQKEVLGDSDARRVITAPGPAQQPEHTPAYGNAYVTERSFLCTFC